ncbi:MAG: tetratricopeptide repeat protein, partial [Bacteroidota bacterium]
ALSFLLFIATIPGDDVVKSTFDAKIDAASDYYAGGDLMMAISEANEAFDHASDYSYDWGQTKALFVLSFLHSQNEEFEKALPYYFEVLETYDQFDTPESTVDKAKVLFNLGNIMHRHHKYTDAIGFYDQGIAFSKTNQLSEMLLDFLHNKTIACRKAGYYNVALETLMTHKELVRQIPDKLLENHNQLGLLYYAQEDYLSAAVHYEKILALEKPHHTAKYSGKAWSNLGQIKFMNGEMNEASMLYHKALEASSQNDAQLLFTCHQALGLISEQQDDMTKSLFHLQQSLKYYETVEKNENNIRIHSQISEVYYLHGTKTLGKQHADLYASEMVELIKRKENLNTIGNQYKIDYITTNYYNKVEKRKNINVFLLIVGAMVCSFLIYLAFQRYRKIQIARLIREQLNAVVFDIDEL